MSDKSARGITDVQRVGVRGVWSWLDGVRQDATYVVRSLRRQPGFAAVAVVTLALGIGANTAIFSVIDTLLLRRPAFEHLERLVTLQESNPQKIPFDVDPSPGNVLDWRELSRSIEYMAAWRNWYFTLGDGAAGSASTESVRGVSVSPTFFSMLGVHPALGRTFERDEETPGRHRVVLLSDGIWRRRFGADPTIVGRTVAIDGGLFTVIGVLPPDFVFFQPDLDIWMPLPVDAPLHDRQNHSVMVFGRLAAGVSFAQAQAEMDAIAAGLSERYPDTNAGWRVKVLPLYPTTAVLRLKPALLVLLAASGLVLLIACANVANLLLARAFARHDELTIRAALGASRARLVRQMLTESIVLALVSGAPAALVGYWGIQMLVPLLPHVGTNKTVATFRAVTPELDGRMLAFSLAVAVFTGIVFGVLPALQTARRVSLRLAGWVVQRPRAGRVLMVAELALSIVLLTGAGLLIESFWNLQRLDPGFRADHLLTMQVWLPKSKYPTSTDIRNFYQSVVRRIDAVPGSAGASAISYRPFLGMGVGTAIEIDGRAVGREEQLVTGYRVVTPGFVRVLGQPLVAGRDFDEHDGPDAEGVAIVNETMARRYWPAGDALGKRIRPAFRRSSVPWQMDATPRWLTVVGVVRDIRGFSLNSFDESQLYVCASQFPFSYMFLTIRTATSPLSVASAVQAQIRAIDPDQPVSDIRTMEDAIAVSVPRFNVELLAVFAVIALFLAAVGVYGVTSYGVSQRTPEICVRMALGAYSRDVVAMVIREALLLAAVGVSLGLIASLMFTRAMSSLLFGVGATDPRAYLGATAILAAVVMVASYVPAYRAARLDPAKMLRA